VAASSSGGVPKASRVPDTKRHGTPREPRCSVRGRSGLPGGCRWVADEHEGGGGQSFGHGHRAHPSAHGATAEGDARSRHTELGGEGGGGIDHGGDENRRPIGSPSPGEVVREVDAFDPHADRTKGAIDGDQRRLLTTGARPGGEDQPATPGGAFSTSTRRRRISWPPPRGRQCPPRPSDRNR